MSDTVRVSLSPSLVEQAPGLMELKGASSLAELLRLCYQNELDRQRPYLLAREKKMARLAAPVLRPGGKMPDSKEVREGKAAYKAIIGWLGIGQANMKDYYKTYFGRFEAKVEDALRERNWAQLVEWNDRQVWSRKTRSTPEEKAYLEEALA